MPYITTENGSRQVAVIVTSSALIFVSLVAVLLRLYCRLFLVRHVGLDDYFILASLTISIGLGIQHGFMISYGTGRQSKDLDFGDFLVPTLKHWFFYQIVYPWGLFFVKASILALYHRIFTQAKFHRLVYFAAIFICIQTITVTSINIFECGAKPSRAWAVAFPEGCNSMPRTYIGIASVNILTDIFILVMPLRALNQLNMHPRKRLALLGIFLVGGIAVVASVVRIYAIYIFFVSKDIPYDDIFILLLSQIEINVAMICASAPALRPLFNKAFGLSSYNHTSEPPIGYASAAPNSHLFPGRSGRRVTHVPMELYSFKGAKKRYSRKNDEAGGTRNTSEESILGGEGITKTVEMRVEEDFVKEQVRSKSGETQGFDGLRRSGV